MKQKFSLVFIANAVIKLLLIQLLIWWLPVICQNLGQLGPERKSLLMRDFTFSEDSGKSEPCRTTKREIGSCIAVSQCPSWNYQDKEPFCSWSGSMPFVCCVAGSPFEKIEKIEELEAVPNLRIEVCGARPLEFARPSRVSRDLVRLRLPRKAVIVGVAGGVNAEPYSWPWMAALVSNAGNRKRFVCGATVISKSYILTAAHCFNTNTPSPSSFAVRLRAHQTGEGTIHDIESIKLHEDYKSNQYYNDIALIKLKEDIIFDDQVTAICLPSSNTNKENLESQFVTVTGWGDTSFGGTSSKVLQEAQFPVVSEVTCNESYTRVASSAFPRGLGKEFICAGLSEGGKDACQGDSGGPLAWQESYNTWVLVGIVSFGYSCAEPGFPGVYTNVAHYLKWIDANSELKEVS